MSKFLTVDEILAAQDIEERVVEIPEWGGAVRIRGFTKARQQAMRQEATVRLNTKTHKAGEIDTSRVEMLMLVEGIIEPKFEAAHIEQLRQKSAGAIERILKAIVELSGMTEAAVDQAEARFQEAAGEAV